MKIEKLEIYGFRNLQNKKIVFDSEKANFLIELNEFGKTTIAEAICAALFGFKPRDITTDEKLSAFRACKPTKGDTYKVAMDVVAQGLRRRIVRDFSRNIAQVFDVDNAGRDITEEFINKKGEYQIGRRMSGLDHNQFLKTCFISQSALNGENDETDLTKLLQRIADSDAGENTVADAIRTLDSALDPFASAKMGKTISVDTEIKRLTNRLDQVSAERLGLQKARARIDPKLKEIATLQEKIAKAELERLKAEYLGLKAECAELDDVLNKQKELHEQKRIALAELSARAKYEHYPSHLESDLVNWIANLSSKRAQLDQHELAVEKNKQALDLLNAELHLHFASLIGMTESDYENFSLLAHDFERTTLQYSEAVGILTAQTNKSPLAGEKVASLHRLEERFKPLEIEQRATLSTHKENRLELERQIAEHKQRADSYRYTINLIDAERTLKKNNSIVILSAGLLLALLIIIFSKFSIGSVLVNMVVGLTSLICVIASVFLQRVALSFHTEEKAQATRHYEKETEWVAEAQERLKKLDQRADDLAQKLSFSSAGELMDALKGFNELRVELLPYLTAKDQVDQIKKEQDEILLQIGEIFSRTGQQNEISLESVQMLRDKIKQYLNTRLQIAAAEAAINENVQLADNIRSDLIGMEVAVRDAFDEAGITEFISLAEGWSQYKSGLEEFKRCEKIKEELNKLESNLKSQDDLAIFESRKSALVAELQSLEQTVPNFATLIPLKMTGEYANEAKLFQQKISTWKDEIAASRQQVAYTLQEYESRSSKLVVEQVEIKKDLSKTQRFKAAVKLARGIFETLAIAIHRHWAIALNQTSREILRKLQTDYEEINFDDQLRFTVLVTGNPAPLQVNQINSQLSSGTRDQLWLLARLAISQYLSDGHLIPPLIFDDPLITSDDNRFKQLMEFIIDKIAQENQVITLSCHQVRFDWLKSQLPELFASRVHFCTLEDL